MTDSATPTSLNEDEKRYFAQLKHEIAEKWPLLRFSDARRLNREWHELKKAAATPGVLARLDRFYNAFIQASERSLKNVADNLHYEFPEELPITAKVPELIEQLRSHQVLIVSGSTGSGKTTQLPKVALAAGLGRSGRIGCTQPRRLAASSLAARVAGEVGCEFGEEVGYQVRFNRHTSENTVIKFLTDGILLTEIRTDPELLQYECLILDEVHERTVNIDFLLGYLKRLLKKRRNLKVIISSATLAAERMSEFFDNAPVITVEGRLFPIVDEYLVPGEDEETPEAVARGVEWLNELDPRGDILVFLPGEREIRETADILNGRRYRYTEILPLFSQLGQADQERIFRPGRERRIILATNVAETSLTIPRIHFVIDSGLVRLSRYNPRTRIQELGVEFVSQASAGQRRGRCGRLQDGVCLHLYSEDDLKRSAEYTDPEILRSSLAGVILQLAELGLPPLEQLELPDPPPPGLLREGRKTLSDLGAFDKHSKITRLGRQLSQMPIDVHLAKMLVVGAKYKILPEMLALTAFLSIPDPRERPADKQQQADAAHREFTEPNSDYLTILKMYNAVRANLNSGSGQSLRKFAKSHFLKYQRLREWRNLIEDLTRVCERNILNGKLKYIDDYTAVPYDLLHQAVLAGLPRNLAAYDPEKREYYNGEGRTFTIFPGSALSKSKKPYQWLISFALVETSRVFGRVNAEAKPEWLEQVAPELCKKLYDQIHYDPASGFVVARERQTCGRLLIQNGRRKHYAPIDPVAAREIFIRDGLVNATEVPVPAPGSWVEHYREQRNMLAKLELKVRRPDSINFRRTSKQSSRRR